ncbi:TPA: hypothetical protein CPT96_03260 [Candidatus Gastranaerophilales bacterium HUM_10]|nr:MAG TPA: hypothetical protein CPT96_03260 [Candidatus Gastranaerophilales bacterium HUM_10]
MTTNLLKKINPMTINSQQGAVQALQKLKTMGLPADIVNQVNRYINSPVANIAFNSLGINKQDFKNGLQSVLGPDASARCTSSILSGIDQLK